MTAIMTALDEHDPVAVGPYRPLRRLGAGGMGQVYLATGEHGLVAVKVVHPALAHHDQFRARFAREVKASRNVVSPWTAAVVDADPDADVPWLATEYVRGVPLDVAVRAAGPLPPATVHLIAANLARALAAIHATGLVHRDVKPGNVMLGADWPRLIDFGISRALDGTRMTSTGSTVGTPAYMSPEQAEGRRLDTASDLFSLGAVLVFAATGLGPFGEGTPISLLRRILSATPNLGHLTEPVRGLVECCLRRDPASRPTATQLADALMPLPVVGPQGWLPRAVAELVPEPPPAEEWPRPVAGAARKRGTSRRSLLLGLGALGLVGAGGGGALAAARLIPTPAAPAARTTGAPRVRWTFATGGKVAGLTVDAGVLYAACEDSVLTALDAATGRPRWSYTLRAQPREAPIVADGAVYVDDGRTLYALDAASGRLRWESASTTLAVAGAGTVIGRRYASSGYALIGIDPAGGAERWQTPIGKASFRGRMAVLTANAAHVGLEESVVAIDLATGAQRWEHPVAKGPKAMAGSADAVHYVSGVVSNPDIVALDPATGAERWKNPAPENSWADHLAADRGAIYVNSGMSLISCDAGSGRPRWGPDAPGKFQVRTAIAMAGDTCYVGGPSYGVEIGKPIDMSDNIYAIATDTGEARWRFRIDTPLDSRSALVAAPGAVFLGTSRSTILAITDEA